MKLLISKYGTSIVVPLKPVQLKGRSSRRNKLCDGGIMEN